MLLGRGATESHLHSTIQKVAERQTKRTSETTEDPTKTILRTERSVKNVSAHCPLVANVPLKARYHKKRDFECRKLPSTAKPEGHTYLKLHVVLRLEFKIRPVEDTKDSCKSNRIRWPPQTAQGR